MHIISMANLEWPITQACMSGLWEEVRLAGGNPCSTGRACKAHTKGLSQPRDTTVLSTAWPPHADSTLNTQLLLWCLMLFIELENWMKLAQAWWEITFGFSTLDASVFANQRGTWWFIIIIMGSQSCSTLELKLHFSSQRPGPNVSELYIKFYFFILKM